MSKLIYVVARKSLRLDHVPQLAGLIDQRRIVRPTPKGYRLCMPDDAPNKKGFLYMSQHYAFYDTHEAALRDVALQANTMAAKLGELKNECVKLMCDAHDMLRQVKTQ